MKTRKYLLAIFLVVMMLSVLPSTESQNKPSTMKEENVTYSIGGVTLHGFVAYDQSIKGKRPAVLVVHEWWGLNDYPKMRVRMLAKLGYIAMAVDMFGNGKTASNPEEAQKLIMPLYKDPQLAKLRLDAAIHKIKEFPQTDATKIAAIGYCFGGSVVLNCAKLGADLKGVVSFHGGLTGVPVNKDLLKAKVLVCHGESDKSVTPKDVEAFKHQMDSIGADYSFKAYPNATHAFTNPESTKNGLKFKMPIAYNAEADKNSWNDMKMFFSNLFHK